MWTATQERAQWQQQYCRDCQVVDAVGDLPSFRGHKSRFKDIVEIRKRIKKLDHTLPFPRYDGGMHSSDLSAETSQ